MTGRFWFYRRRRVLPFLAAYALVFINAATLTPFVAPFPTLSDGPQDGAAADFAADDFWWWLQVERGRGEEPDDTVAAAMPPLVKNLRRAPPPRHFKAVAGGGDAASPDAPRPQADFLQRALAANAADLTRLCRLLL